MTTYRVYRLCPRGKIRTGYWVEAADDRDVRAKAVDLCDDGCPNAEIWLGAKRLAIIARGTARQPIHDPA